MPIFVIWTEPDTNYPSACHEKGVEPLTKMHEEEGLVVSEEFEADTPEEAFAYHKAKTNEFFSSVKNKGNP